MKEVEYSNKDKTEEPLTISAAISSKIDSSKIFATTTTQMIFPNEYTNEKFYAIRLSELSKARNILEKISGNRSNYSELVFSSSFVFFGVFFGSFLSSGNLFDSANLSAICRSILSLVLGIILFAFGCVNNYKKNLKEKYSIDRVLEILVDPKNSEKGEDHEHK